MVSTTRLVVRLVDRLLAGYFAAVTIIIAIRGNIFERDIIFVLFAHILFFVLLWLFTKLGPANTVGAFFHDFYPVMLLLACNSSLRQVDRYSIGQAMSRHS